MATIIDFSPAATEISNTAGPLTASAIPVITQPIGNIATAGSNTDQLINTFHTNAPDILFICEYIVNGVNQGNIIAWEDYYSATHYELFKRNRCAVDQTWERFLFLDSDTLTKETKNYTSYIEQYIGLPMTQNNYYAILDTDNSVDRIYEYYIGAGYYPSNANIDFVPIMKSKNLINTFTIGANDTLDTVATNVYGTSDMGWVICLLNPLTYFFGPIANSKPLNQFVLNQGYVNVPNDTDSLIAMISEAIYIFGLKNALTNLFTRTNLSNASLYFYQTIIASIDNASHSLSYSKANNTLIANNSNYRAAQAKGANVNLITSNQYPDDTYFGSALALSVIFARVNSLLTSYIYGSPTSLNSVAHVGTVPLAPNPVSAFSSSIQSLVNKPSTKVLF